MATRQQRIQQERQRQREEAAARQQLPDRPLGAEALDAIEQDVATFVQLPGVRQTLGFAAGAVNMVNEAVLEPARYAATDPSQAGTPLALAGTALTFGEGLMEKSAEGGAILAEKMGVDPRIGGFVGGTAAETLLTAGLGAAGRKITQAVDMIPPGGTMPQLAMAGAAPMPPMTVAPSFERGGLVMKAVTSQHTEALELTGRKTGEEIVGADVAIGKQLTKRKKDIQSVESDIKYYKEALEGLDELKGDPRNLRAFVGEDPDLSRLWNRYVEKYGPDKVFAKVRSKYAEQKAAADTMWSRIKSNVLPFEKKGDYSKWYASSAAKPFKQKAEKILRARGELQIKEYLQQHHLIPKGMTAAYFDKMDQLIASGKAKLDDLVLMAEVAAAKGKPTGDVKVNIEDMIPKPHNEMHMVLRSQGAEVAKSKLIKDLSKVNTVDELMEKWVREFDPDGNFTYNYETAKVWEGLDKLLKELRGS